MSRQLRYRPQHPGFHELANQAGLQKPNFSRVERNQFRDLEFCIPGLLNIFRLLEWDHRLAAFMAEHVGGSPEEFSKVLCGKEPNRFPDMEILGEFKRLTGRIAKLELDEMISPQCEKLFKDGLRVQKRLAASTKKAPPKELTTGGYSASVKKTIRELFAPPGNVEQVTPFAFEELRDIFHQAIEFDRLRPKASVQVSWFKHPYAFTRALFSPKNIGITLAKIVRLDAGGELENALKWEQDEGFMRQYRGGQLDPKFGFLAYADWADRLHVGGPVDKGLEEFSTIQGWGDVRFFEYFKGFEATLEPGAPFEVSVPWAPAESECSGYAGLALREFLVALSVNYLPAYTGFLDMLEKFPKNRVPGMTKTIVEMAVRHRKISDSPWEKLTARPEIVDYGQDAFFTIVKGFLFEQL